MQQRIHTQQRDPGKYTLIHLFKLMLVIEIHKTEHMESIGNVNKVTLVYY